jgi:hypothetical protein
MMGNLNLGMPTHLTEALRTNMSGGKTVSQLLSEGGSQVSFMSMEELKSRLESEERSLLVLDVRERDAYLEGHIPGAKLLPRGQLELRVNQELPDPTRRVLVYCDLGKVLDARGRDAARDGVMRAPSRSMVAWSRGATRDTRRRRARSHNRIGRERVPDRGYFRQRLRARPRAWGTGATTGRALGRELRAPVRILRHRVGRGAATRGRISRRDRPPRCQSARRDGRHCRRLGAQGSEILALNARTELLPPSYLGKAGVPSGECTAIAVRATASATSGTLLAQNWDWLGSSARR